MLAAAVRDGHRAAIVVIALSALVAWWLYVPIHELAHARVCLLAAGRVTRLEIAESYGVAWLARVFPFVTAGSEYAGRQAASIRAGAT